MNGEETTAATPVVAPTEMRQSRDVQSLLYPHLFACGVTQHPHDMHFGSASPHFAVQPGYLAYWSAQYFKQTCCLSLQLIALADMEEVTTKRRIIGKRVNTRIAYTPYAKSLVKTMSAINVSASFWALSATSVWLLSQHAFLARP